MLLGRAVAGGAAGAGAISAIGMGIEHAQKSGLLGASAAASGTAANAAGEGIASQILRFTSDQLQAFGNAVVKVGQQVMVTVQSHPYPAVILGSLLVAGVMYYLCRPLPVMPPGPPPLLPSFSDAGSSLTSDALPAVHGTPSAESAASPEAAAAPCVAVNSPQFDEIARKHVLGECKLCLDKSADCLLVPCLHRMCCSDCFGQLMEKQCVSGQPLCPLCRIPIQMGIKHA